MARPKSDPNVSPAKERIRTAFWDILSRKGYDAVTIKRLSRDADINHKTIYYYYENVDSMAEEFFSRDVEESGMDRFLYLLLNVSPLPAEEEQRLLETPASRVWLYARGDSPYLMSIITEHLEEFWLFSVGLAPGLLDGQDKFELDCAFRALTAALGEAMEKKDPGLVSRMMSRELGQGIKATLAAVSGGRRSF
ncbi:MAG: TetR/AcrR family transcriptional regulator [Oscillospiraceae bacterium]|nr:TetR/AcrR family transcriptional regulator [Oscillospiraceae bacterium]